VLNASVDFLNPPGRAERGSLVWLRVIAGEPARGQRELAVVTCPSVKSFGLGHSGAGSAEEAAIQIVGTGTGRSAFADIRASEPGKFRDPSILSSGTTFVQGALRGIAFGNGLKNQPRTRCSLLPDLTKKRTASVSALT
jgi:hypothetical protein